MEPLIKFGFPEKTIKTFTQGSCDTLAIYLKSEFYGNTRIYEIDLIGDLSFKFNLEGIHSVIRAPRDYLERFGLNPAHEYFIDILGIWSKSALITYWENEIRNGQKFRDEYNFLGGNFHCELRPQLNDYCIPDKSDNFFIKLSNVVDQIMFPVRDLYPKKDNF